jgi:uncharacterized SAM-binding protein YcdF (DUF218 family)
MDYELTKLLGVLLTPGAALLIFLLVALLLLWTRRHWRRGRALLTFTVLGLLILLAIGPSLLSTLEDRFPANPGLPARVDGIVVLGGAVDQYISQARHQVSLNDAAERLTETVLLAKAHPEARVLFTGGSADPWRPEPREASYAAQLLVALGVSADRLIVEDQSRNTHENAVESYRLAKPQPGQVWVLVTSACHMPRAVGTFRRAGWSAIPWPVDFRTDDGADWTNQDLVVRRLSLLGQAAHEWIGLAYYRLAGWSDALFPAQ